jgi:AraC-like DNA-binding protein
MLEPGKFRFAPPCDSTDARFERAVRYRGMHIRVESFEGDVFRTVTTTAELSYDGAALIFSQKGTVLYRTEREAGWRVIAPNSVTFVETPASATIRVAKGAHSLVVANWTRGTLPILEHWLDARREGKPSYGRPIGTQPVSPSHTDAYERFGKALELNESHSEHMIGAVALELASSLLTIDASHSLAPVPPELPELMRNLVDEVRLTPSTPWPLKEAADFVGYSPFHFSRIFKVQVGMGFHEFVDRTRTEYAVHLLTTTDHPIDVVASEAGFGTTQGLRESVKEYLGLVPSELRTSPDDYAL